MLAQGWQNKQRKKKVRRDGGDEYEYEYYADEYPEEYRTSQRRGGNGGGHGGGNGEVMYYEDYPG